MKVNPLNTARPPHAFNDHTEKCWRCNATRIEVMNGEKEDLCRWKFGEVKDWTQPMLLVTKSGYKLQYPQITHGDKDIND